MPSFVNKIVVLAAASSMALSIATPDARYPADYFDSPLSVPLSLAGNFAEMRSGHFHSGLDLKTMDREGLPVFAAADGWVSRIKVSATGYGNALYLTHPNGYTTVYAHLQRFSDDISGHVESLQYAKRRFALNTYPGSDSFPVKQGDVIGYSGNSGSSKGPHLHFEVRDAASQTPINPLLFGFDVADSVAPTIYRLKVYPLSKDGYVRLDAGNAEIERHVAART